MWSKDLKWMLMGKLSIVDTAEVIAEEKKKEGDFKSAMCLALCQMLMTHLLLHLSDIEVKNILFYRSLHTEELNSYL